MFCYLCFTMICYVFAMFCSFSCSPLAKHKTNVEVLLQKPVGVAEHPDTLETIEKELRIIADYDDQLEMLKKYF